MNDRIRQAHLQIGRNIKQYRKLRGVSQLNLAIQMGYESVSIVSMAEVCTRDKHFNVEHLIKIAEILEIDICVLFDGI